MLRTIVAALCLTSASAFMAPVGDAVTRSAVNQPAVNMALIQKPSKKILQKYNSGLAARKKASVGSRGGKFVEGGVEKVKFPVDGGPERAAAGQAGAPFLIAGLLPLLVELSRVSQLPSSGFGMGSGP